MIVLRGGYLDEVNNRCLFCPLLRSAEGWDVEAAIGAKCDCASWWIPERGEQPLSFLCPLLRSAEGWKVEAAIGATQSVIVLRGGYLDEVNNRCLFLSFTRIR